MPKLTRRPYCVFFLSLLLFILSIDAFGQRPVYGVQDLAPDTRSDTSQFYYPKKINDNGYITGFKSYNSDSVSQYWVGGREFPAGGPNSVAYDISNNNLIVGRGHFGGGSNRAYTFNPPSQSLIWLPCPVFTQYGAFCEAYGVNSSGAVVGTSDPRFLYPENPEASSRALWWDENGAVEIFPNSGVISVANDINSSGKVVGMYDYEPFIWSSTGGTTLLGSHSNTGTVGEMVFAQAINDNNHVVGGHTTNSEGLAQRAFFWNGTSAIDIGTLGVNTYPAGTSTPVVGANDINNADQVVGRAIIGNDQHGLPATHAFIWDPQNGMRDLNNMISPSLGIVLTEATGINNNGDIVAVGYELVHNNSGLRRAYLLKQPEPLIFIPGIAGSTLFEAQTNGTLGQNIWADGIYPFDSRLNKLTLNPADQPFPNIVAGDALETAPLMGDVYKPLLDHLVESGFIRYQIGNTPKKRSTQCNETETYDGYKPKLFVFAYDWRLTNVSASEQLAQYIDCVRKFYPGQNVNLLTHSMGGLIARRYVLDHQINHHINKMITMVAPFLGAPRAIDGLLTRRFVGTKKIWVIPIGGGGLFWKRGALNNVTPYSKGAHELLPSAWYFSLGGRPFGYTSAVGSYTEYEYFPTYDYINGEFPATLPYKNAHDFHNYMNASQDNWSSDTTGIKYYHLYGEQSASETPKTIFAGLRGSLPLRVEKIRYAVETIYGRGDGTVPSLSARRALNLLAPNTIQKKCLSPSTDDDELYEHNGITKNPVMWKEIHNILDNVNLEQPECETEFSTLNGSNNNGGGNSSGSGNNSLLSTTQQNSLKVYGVERLDLTDDQGNANTPVSPVADSAVPDVLYEYGSTAGESLLIPHQVMFSSGKVMDVKFTAPADKIQIELARGYSPEATDEAVKYLDLQLPTGVTALLKFTANGVENLRYDADGDGVFETEVQPTLTLSGQPANDKTAPVIEASVTVDNNNTATVTLNADDGETGVKEIRYIILGESTDHIYTSPITLSAAQSNLIYISAEDNAGNRSILAKWIDVFAPDTSFSQTPPANGNGWNTSDVTMALKALDDTGGSGVNTFTYSASGAQPVAEQTLARKDGLYAFPQPSTSADYLSKTFNIFTEGVTTFTYFAKDKAGNIEATKTQAIKIDKSSPITRHSSASDGQQTTFTLTATDAVSGVSEIVYSIDGGAAQNYSAPFTVSDTGGHYVSFFARDLAGNEEAVRTVYVNPGQVAKSVLISEFRTRGYNGADDEFIELYNNGETAVDISGWTISVKQGSNSTPLTLATINSGAVIPPRGHYLLRKDGASNYSLSAYAEADQTYTGALADNIGIKLVSDSSLAIDAVGFSGVADASYREGTALAPSTGISANGQYSFVRNYTRAGLVDSNSNRADFVFVATDAGTYNSLKAVLGSPGPENLNSPVYREGSVLITQIDDKVTLAEAPNRLYDYTAGTPPYPVGMLSVRRKLTNNTGGGISALRIRITGITTKNSTVTFPQQAILRSINSADITVTSLDGQRTYPLRGLTIESVPTTVDAGLNSTLTFSLGTALANGESVSVDLKSGIVVNGQYKLEFRVEAVASTP